MTTTLRHAKSQPLETAAPSEAPGTFPKGRRCALCHHTLSVYNPADKCFRHQRPRYVTWHGEHGDRPDVQDFQELLEGVEAITETPEHYELSTSTVAEEGS